MVSGGQRGIASAYEKLQLEKRPYTIIYDLTPKNRKILEMDIADFIIDQEGYVQGYESLYILADILQKNSSVDQECRYTDISIKTKYSL